MLNLEIVDGARVRACLPMAVCIQTMAGVLAAIARGEIEVPQRLKVELADGEAQLLAMPGALADPAVLGAKLISLFPGNPAQERPAVQGVIVLFDPNTGAPTALLDAASLTAIRTAAASAAASEVLARDDAHVLALLGCGVQAETHLEAMLAVRPIDRVLVWGRSQSKARTFAEWHALKYELPIEVAPTAQAAVEAADLICTLTHSPTPILQGAWLQPGSHLNLVGAHTPTTREADTAAVHRARVFVEARAAAWKEAGDLVIPLQEGAIDQGHVIGEIGQVILGQVVGRQARQDVTLYKSLGNSAQDLAAAREVLQQLRKP
ncbi:MAG TPA: ornithine cyclodeaminase family protein [Planctomycetota bacterium]